MSAQDRLRAAILASVPAGGHGQLCGITYGSECDCFIQDKVDARMERIWAADPDLDQDIADGQALRLLREALPDANHFVTVESPFDGFGWTVSVDTIYHELSVVRAEADTIAEAADACRKALEARS